MTGMWERQWSFSSLHLEEKTESIKGVCLFVLFIYLLFAFFEEHRALLGSHNFGGFTLLW